MTPSVHEKRNEAVDQFVENLDLDELTQEDKFFLIQQIEDLNKNIRYCQNASPYIFEEDDTSPKPQSSQSPDPIQSLNFASLENKNVSFHRHGARGVRGARKLDIILDEEEENEVEPASGSRCDSKLNFDEKNNSLVRDKGNESIFYKKGDL